jgi:hypothetical protein
VTLPSTKNDVVKATTEKIESADGDDKKKVAVVDAKVEPKKEEKPEKMEVDEPGANLIKNVFLHWESK